MSDCTDNIPIENLDGCPGEEMVPGVSETKVYFSPIDDFLTIAAPPKGDTAGSNSEYATIAEAHTFKEGKGFHKVQFTPFSGKVDSTHVGEPGNLSIQNSLTGTIKGTGAKVAGHNRRYLNTPGIWIVFEKNGDVKQIGSELSPAYMSEVTATSGAKAGDAKSTIYKVMDTQSYMAPQYNGTVQEFPAPAPV